jgi:predicted DNA-binding transcriptional regulator AlpA
MTHNASTDTPPLAFSVPEFCRAVGISVRGFYSLRARGEAPPSIKIGDRRVIRRENAEKWLARRETTRTDPRELKLDVVRDCLVSIVGAPEDSAKAAEWASDALDALAEARGVTPDFRA